MNLIEVVNQDHAKASVKDIPDFRTGDTLAVSVRITEGEKSRLQVFQGVCIGIKGKGKMNGHFRMRKISSGYGVERVFPFHSPLVEQIKVMQKGKTKRSKLYYLRERSGKGARISIDYDRK